MTLKKISALALAALMLCSVLCACTNPQNGGTSGTTITPNPSGSSSSGSSNTTSKPNTDPSGSAQDNKAIYQVAVFGADGKPAVSGVVVRFMQNGEQVTMQTMNASGVAEKELPKGDYTVELYFTNSEASYYYDTTDLTLSKTKTQLTIHLCLEQSTEGKTVYVNGDGLFADEFTAYPLATGNTYVTLKPGRNYFLYNPSESGEYQLYTAGGAYVTGYYGGEHFIMRESAGKEAPNNGTAISISANMISPENNFVIGVDNPGTEDVQVVLHAIRVSDYIDTSIPVEIYKATAALNPWTMPSGSRVTKFDITATVPYKLVKDSNGFYHLNTVAGPLVVVFLGQNAAKYMDYLAPYDTVLKNSSVAAYFQNEDGTYSKREDYSDCLMDYIGTWDENTSKYTGGCVDRNSGLYPLTDDLMYIIQQHGNYSGWWDVDDERYLFGDVTVNKENAWLFMCGYLG